jgi:uncharacterized protein DUF222/HNH endonuclease
MTPLTTTPHTTADAAVAAAAAAGTPVGPQPVVSCSDAELVAEITEIERTIRAARMRQLQLIAEAEHRGLFTSRGARSMPAWLQGLLNIDPRDAKTRVRVARDVLQPTSEHGEPPLATELPATARALAAGEIGVEHARVISDCVHGLPEATQRDTAGTVDAVLAGHARRVAPRELVKLAEQIKYTLDKDGAYQEEENQYESRELHYGSGRDGMLVIKARLDRETGAKFVEALRPLSAPRPENNGEKDPRTAGQRHADGLAAMVDLVLDSDQMPRTGGQRPHLTVTINFDDLKQRLLNKESMSGVPGVLDATGHSLTPENIRRIACDADVLPMVLGSDSLPLDVGTSQRTAPTHIRAALLQRDGVCAFPRCDRPPGTPQAHHIRHWIDGGTTELSNMVMLCGHHHRVIHSQGWDITMHLGRPLFTPPSSVDRTRTPRPGGKAFPAAYRDDLRELIPAPRDPEDTP